MVSDIYVVDLMRLRNKLDEERKRARNGTQHSLRNVVQLLDEAASELRRVTIRQAS